MLKNDLAEIISAAIRSAQAAGTLPAFALPEVEVEHPRDASHGDFATSVALKLAREAKLAPVKIAQAISAQLPLDGMIGAAAVAPPGFINIRLGDAFLARQVDTILQAGAQWGNVDVGRGKRAQVEFVSANPTGPLHMGSARNAAIGDVLASILAAANYHVEREYYINDNGSQIRKFGESVYARYAQALGQDVPFPEKGYQGEYISEVAKALAEQEGDKYLHMPQLEATRALGRIGTDAMVESARQTLAEMGITFDVWFAESSLYDPSAGGGVQPYAPKGQVSAADSGVQPGAPTRQVPSAGSGVQPGAPKGQVSAADSGVQPGAPKGQVPAADSGVQPGAPKGQSLFERVYQLLQEKGLVLEKDGAVWFAAQELGEDKDAVIIRSADIIADPRERPTYFASDIAYMWNKFVERKFDKVVYVWGSDHHGDVARVKAARRALDLPGEMDIIIYQFVNIVRHGEQVRMSKRSGDFVMLSEVLREVGVDAVRYMLLTRSADNVIEFDLGVAVAQENKNPVHYVKYGHARIASILRKAKEQELAYEDGNVQLLVHPSEQALIRKLLALPEQIELGARLLTPHILTHYALELATLFHKFYEDCRVLSTAEMPVEPETSKARLKLARATQQVLARTLGLMGMSAPESM